jgi:hypothetical protein
MQHDALSLHHFGGYMMVDPESDALVSLDIDVLRRG